MAAHIKKLWELENYARLGFIYNFAEYEQLVRLGYLEENEQLISALRGAATIEEKIKSFPKRVETVILLGVKTVKEAVVTSINGNRKLLGEGSSEEEVGEGDQNGNNGRYGEQWRKMYVEGPGKQGKDIKPSNIQGGLDKTMDDISKEDKPHDGEEKE